MSIYPPPPVQPLATTTLRCISMNLAGIYLFIDLPLACESSQARVKLELQLLAYATATPDQSLVGDLHHSWQQHRSLTNWSRPGIEPVSSWILVRFITAESQWEFLVYFFNSEIHLLNLTLFNLSQSWICTELFTRFCFHKPSFRNFLFYPIPFFFSPFSFDKRCLPYKLLLCQLH